MQVLNLKLQKKSCLKKREDSESFTTKQTPKNAKKICDSRLKNLQFVKKKSSNLRLFLLIFNKLNFFSKSVCLKKSFLYAAKPLPASAKVKATVPGCHDKILQGASHFRQPPVNG